MTENQYRRALRKAATGKSVDVCAERVVAVAAQHARMIIPRLDLRQDSNCFAFALQLSDELLNWARRGKVFVDGCFVKVLIHRAILRRRDQPSGDGSLILYVQNENRIQSIPEIPTHAGVLTGSRVLSKWGDGAVLEHDTLDVPDNYGNHIRYYDRPPLDLVEEIWIDYARFLSSRDLGPPPVRRGRNENS